MLKKILVIQTAFIGDVILATAILEQLNHEYGKNAAIDILVRKGNEEMFHQHPFVRKVLIWNKNQKIISLWQQFKIIRKEKYNWVVNLQRHASTGFLTAFSGAEKRSGFSSNPFSILFTHKQKHKIQKGTHEIDRNAMLVEPKNHTISRPQLYPSAENKIKVAQWQNNKYICIAPASVWFTKQLPLHQWKILLQRIPSQFTIYILGGKTDEKIAQELIQTTNYKNIISLCGQLTFLESAWLMKNAEMNYVNDSGPLHLASSMNAPVTAFFCSTIPDFGFGPLSDQQLIAQTDMPLSCKPCHLHGKKFCPKQHFDCANTIDIYRIPIPHI